MELSDNVKQIVFRPGADGRGDLEITLESGTVYHKTVLSRPFMLSIAQAIRLERAIEPDLEQHLEGSS